MLISIKLNNCFIFNKEVFFSMRADMRYKRFSSNVYCSHNANVLKSAVIIGPNNTGKTNFVRCLSGIKDIMLNHGINVAKNMFSGNAICEFEITFLVDETEYVYEVNYNVASAEYVYERFAKVSYDTSRNRKEANKYVRDTINENYQSDDNELSRAMKTASKSNILIYLLDTKQFETLESAKKIIVGFASKLDILDMNNIPINKTIEMMKMPGSAKQKIVNFILNADLSMDDYKYLNDDELKIEIKSDPLDNMRPQENALNSVAPIVEMLHLSSVYKGIPVPSILYDSTGTKKIASVASYVIDALENGRTLIVDELDNSLHFKLTRAIIALFNNELNNNGQLICTVHDISLLDCQRLFRKEQIWFTSKDRDNAYLYSLSEFKYDKDGVRETTDIIERYKQGVFGALPEPELFESLLEVRKDV